MRKFDSNGNPIQEVTTEGVKTVDAENSMNYTEKNIKPEVSRRKCPLSDNMIKHLVKQISAELSNHSLYLTFANYFDTEGLSKLGKYFRDRAHEEYNHHNWIFEYLCDNDAVFQYPPVPPVNVDITDRIFPFSATVDREIETTMSINRIVDLAKEEGDWATFNWLLSDDDETGKLILEQIEEESISRTICDLAREEASWLRKENAIIDFYNSSRSDD